MGAVQIDFRQRAQEHYGSDEQIENIERIVSYLSDLKKCLIVLEDGSISHDEKRRKGVFLLLERVIDQISKITGDEFRFFLSPKESQFFKSLVDDIKRSFDEKTAFQFTKGLPEFLGKFGSNWIRKLKEKIELVEKMEEKMNLLLKDEKFLRAMETEARIIGRERPLLSSRIKGCYHGFPEQKVLSILGSGIASNTFRKYAMRLMIESPLEKWSV